MKVRDVVEAVVIGVVMAAWFAVGMMMRKEPRCEREHDVIWWMEPPRCPGDEGFMMKEGERKDGPI